MTESDRSPRGPNAKARLKVIIEKSAAPDGTALFLHCAAFSASVNCWQSRCQQPSRLDIYAGRHPCGLRKLEPFPRQQ